MTDFSHLDALTHRLHNETIRLNNAKTAKERELRSVWIAQIAREIAGECKFLGIEPPLATANVIDLDELLNELLS